MENFSGVIEVMADDSKSGVKYVPLTNAELIEWAKSVIKGHYNVGRYSTTSVYVLAEPLSKTK